MISFRSFNFLYLHAGFSVRPLDTTMQEIKWHRDDVNMNVPPLSRSLSPKETRLFETVGATDSNKMVDRSSRIIHVKNSLTTAIPSIIPCRSGLSVARQINGRYFKKLKRSNLIHSHRTFTYR